MRIVVAYDGSPHAEVALGWAREVARETGADLHLAHALQMPPIPSAPPQQSVAQILGAAEARARQALEAAAAPLRREGLSVDLHIRHWFPVETILLRAQEVGAGLIVLGQRGSNRAERLLMGTVSSEVVRLAHIPVLVARGAAPTGPARRVLVAVDGSSHSVRALSAARQFFPNADLTACHVAAGPGEGTAALVAHTVAAAGVDPDRVAVRVRSGEAAPELLAELVAGGYHVAVLGSLGLGTLTRLLLGSVSDKVLGLAPCPVLIVR